MQKLFTNYGKLQLRSQNDIVLHTEVRKRGNQIKKGDKEIKLSDFDTHKDEVIEEVKNIKHNYFEDIVYRLELIYTGREYMLFTKYIAATSIRLTLPPGIFEISDINSTLKTLLSDEVKENITIDDIRLRSKLTTDKTKRLSKNSFLQNIRFYSTTLKLFR